jgi:hypothetical protein
MLRVLAVTTEALVMALETSDAETRIGESPESTTLKRSRTTVIAVGGD